MSPVELPGWLTGLAQGCAEVPAEQVSRFLPPAGLRLRRSAVLILLADGEADRGPDVLLIQRASTLREHAGQPAFPGGAVDPGDEAPIGTALREAQEETGLDPAGVVPFAVLPELWLPPSGFAVAPVVAWWQQPSPVAPQDPAEVERVERVTLAELADPGHRFRVSNSAGWQGPAFDVRGMLVWGFTAGLLSTVLDLGGWTEPWDTTDVRPAPVGPREEAAALEALQAADRADAAAATGVG